MLETVALRSQDSIEMHHFHWLVSSQAFNYFYDSETHTNTNVVIAGTNMVKQKAEFIPVGYFKPCKKWQ